MIRKAIIADLVEINDIYNQAVMHGTQTADTEPISLKKRREWFENHNIDQYPVFVFEIDKKVVGWLTLSAYRSGRKALESVAEISYYIHKDFQGCGIGSQLAKFGIEIAPTYNFENLVAILLGSNSVSVKLLEKFNFRHWGTLPGVAQFANQKVDHLYYGLKL